MHLDQDLAVFTVRVGNLYHVRMTDVNRISADTNNPFRPGFPSRSDKCHTVMVVNVFQGLQSDIGQRPGEKKSSWGIERKR
jgi:hypothetical protein